VGVPGDIVSKTSPRGFDETVARLLEVIRSTGLKVFDVIDQRDEASHVGLDLRPTTLVMFGNPVAGTPIMQAFPLSALDLPLKILIWSDDDVTHVSYYSPQSIAEKHGLGDLVANISRVEALASAVVSA
jgi:uncharacterized protein (DUF302 family)